MNSHEHALVLLSCGDNSQIAALQAAAAAPLAQTLGLTLQPALVTLQTLPEHSLFPLGTDPGTPLQATGHWAERLGAARQCCLLLLDAEQAAGGLPAAATALLQQWRVPLVGLVQWGQPWLEPARRRDGLPWLGWLDASAASDEARIALALAAQLRWQQQLALQH